MKRILALLLTACLLCSLLVGCGVEEVPYAPTGDALDQGGAPVVPSPPEGQVLTLTYYPDLSMNPYTCVNYTNRVVFSLLYQGLFSVDRDYQVEPVLCQSYRISADGKTYTFRLARAWFPDGTAITAGDVVESLKAARRGAYYSGRFQHILSISEQEGAVVITLDVPCENLPMLLDIPIVKADQINAEFPIGTGPYFIEEQNGTKQLRRQAAWWTEANCVASAATIPLIEASSINQIRDSFEFGSLDLVCADPGNEAYADYRCDYEVWNCDSGILLYLVCHTDSWLFSDPTLRRALTHAIDRDMLADTFYRGFATPATLPADPASPFYNTSLANRYVYDPEAFAAALESANIPENEEAIFAVNGDDALRVRVAKYLVDMLNASGLKVRLEEVPEKKFRAYLEEGKFDLYLGQTKLSPNMDLTAFFSEGGNLSYGDLADTTLLALNQKALANRGNFYNLHEQIMANGNLIPILTLSYAIYATRGVVTELAPARDHIFYYSTGRKLSDALTME